VGRAGEAETVAGLLARYRMVTVTGPGGVGKTRLAGEVAPRVESQFADGVWLVELAGVQNPAHVPFAVAAALRMLEAPSLSIPGLSVIDSLVTGLARQQLLLVLDNCEHVLGAVAELCGTLLRTADDLRVLATSREPAGITGEARYRLWPLAVSSPPDLAAPGGLTTAATPAAVALFADRARQADPRFLLDSESGPLVAQIVTRLDGMPLAIELAAARAEALGLAALLDRLDDDFRLLTGGDRAGAPRQWSLRATVDWSYRLLNALERLVFARLAVFPGPFTLDAAIAVAGVPGAERAVLRLVDCSLLTPPQAGVDGRARYRMLETLRAFGIERLSEAGEHAGSAAALAGYALQVAERAAGGMMSSPGELAATRELDAEEATLDQALAWAQEHDGATAIRLATALSPWWDVRGRSAEGYPLLLAAAAHAEPGRDRWCTAQFWLGMMAASSGEVSAALTHYTAACDALAAEPPGPALAMTLAGRANMLLLLGRVADGTAEARRALALADELRYPAGRAFALLCMTNAAAMAGDGPAAVQWARQACAIDPAAISGNLARSSRTNLTMALVEAGETDAARANCVAALALAQEAGDLEAEASSRYVMAELDLEAGQLADACAQLAAALKLATRMRDQLGLWDCLHIGAKLLAASRRWPEAVTAWAAHSAVTQDSGLSDGPRSARQREELLEEAARELGPGELRAAHERGAAMPLETAAELLLLLTETGLLAQAAASPAGLPELSAREQELVVLVARGRTDAQIAGQLYISVSTVRSHLDRIRDKTGCRRRADLTRLALRAGLA
jgi:predicted ATPase/DNA-binding CsgD family transcriptional regulator